MRKTKVGIMTLYFNYNYGALLQAYALHKTIKELGYDVENIRYYREIDGESTYRCKAKKKTIGTLVKRLFRKDIFKSMHRKILERKNGIIEKIQRRKNLFDDFIKDEIQESNRSYDGHDNISLAVADYDIFVCGSDNIWNKNMLDTSFMLDFVPEDKLKIAYAPGMSTDVLTTSQQEKILPCISRLQYISCRESMGAQLLTSLLKKEVVVTLDPTLLRDKTQWSKIEKKPNVDIPSEYIFCYFCGEEKVARDKAKELSNKYNIPIVTLPDISGHLEVEYMNFGDVRVYDAGPREFIYLINYAKYVFTDSFHGTVFSIIFHKQFVCFRRFFEMKNKSLNYRIDNILKMLEIGEKKIIQDIEQDVNESLNAEIDWNKIDKNINKFRTSSLSYLNRALKDDDNKLYV